VPSTTYGRDQAWAALPGEALEGEELADSAGKDRTYKIPKHWKIVDSFR
jgi:hypothetical protein